MNQALKNSQIDNEIEKLVTREMSITVEQFTNLLPEVDKSMLSTSNRQPGQYELVNRAGTVRITCKQSSPRQLGSLSVPVLRVDLDFTRYESNRIKTFMNALDDVFVRIG